MRRFARHFRTSWLRLFFWICWAVLMALPLGHVLAEGQHRPLSQWLTLAPLAIIPLCYLSAECVEREPELAWIGMLSITAYLFWLILDGFVITD